MRWQKNRGEVAFSDREFAFNSALKRLQWSTNLCSYCSASTVYILLLYQPFVRWEVIEVEKNWMNKAFGREGKEAKYGLKVIPCRNFIKREVMWLLSWNCQCLWRGLAEEKEESRFGGGRLNLWKHNKNNKLSSNIQLCGIILIVLQISPWDVQPWPSLLVNGKRRRRNWGGVGSSSADAS